MDQQIDPTVQFEAERARLFSLAYRFLGNRHDAEDAVQEAWIRLSTADRVEIDNLGGWLTTVLSRICLNVLRTRQRRPITLADDLDHVARTPVDLPVTPEQQVVLADSLGPALLVVLDALNPAERIALVLHDIFSVSFEDVAAVLGKSEQACRQLASRARRRVRTAQDPAFDPERQRHIVTAFLRAAKSGEFQTLLSLLSPDVTLAADPAAVAIGAPELLIGPDAVAGRFSGGARAARAAFVDGLAGLVWAQGGRAKVVFDFTISNGRVTRIEMVSDEDVLGEMEIDYLGRPDRGDAEAGP